MEIWEILVLVPYILIVGWILISFSMITTGNIGAIFAGAAFFTAGLAYIFLYTEILGIALLIRWMIQRNRRANQR